MCEQFEQPKMPFLGCSIRSLNDQPGMEILLVNTDSPAWNAGIKIGDLLLEIDGSQVNNIHDYRSTLEKVVVQGAKRRVIFKILRKGEYQTCEVFFNQL